MRLVVKIGGSLLTDAAPDSLLADVAKLAQSNELVLVHGGGELVTQIAQKMGKEQRFIVSPEGIRSRFTDRETVDIYTMVMSGLISKRLTSALAARGVRAVSLSGLDGSLMSGARKKRLVSMDERGRRVVVEGGYTGKVRGFNPDLIQRLHAGGYLPLISPVAIGEEGEPLNVDGDRAAASAALATKADAVVFLTNVRGLLADGQTVERLGIGEARSLLPSIGFGMQKKVMASIECVEGGVPEAIICSGVGPTPISSGLSHVGCTVIS